MKVTYFEEGRVGLETCLCRYIEAEGTDKLRLVYNFDRSYKVINVKDIVLIMPYSEVVL